jgi:large subunit ribosomal protein L32
MAVPFRKISKTRGRMRRTHYKLEAANTVVCKNCGASIKPHRVCPECGFYKGKNVTEKVAKEEKVVETKKATPKAKKETKKVEKKTTAKKTTKKESK